MEFLGPGDKVTAELTNQITVQLRHSGNRHLEVQTNGVFKDVNGIATRHETP